jgi:hypothetical protein
VSLCRRRALLLTLAALYGVELLDELIYGLQGAVLPRLRDDLDLSYTQVGLLFTVPGLVSVLGEPIIGVLGDTRHRKSLVVGGMGATAVGLALTGVGESFAGLRSAQLLHWVLLTELGGLMLDTLLEVTGLYFHDVVGVSLAEASGAVAIFTVAGLMGNAFVVPALERVRGLGFLRITAMIVLATHAAWLLIPLVWLKFVLIGVISFCTSGWYAVLRAQCYAALPGQSGVVVSITSLGSVASFFVPALLGRIADTVGLGCAMWLLALGPLVLIIGMPRSGESESHADPRKEPGVRERG